MKPETTKSDDPAKTSTAKFFGGLLVVLLVVESASCSARVGWEAGGKLARSWGFSVE